MPRLRLGVLAVSASVVLFVIAGGLALRVGAAEGSFRQVIQFSEVLGLVLDNYVDEVQQESLLVGAYEGLMGGLDARGAYLTSAEVAAWKKPVPEGQVDSGLSVLKAGGALQIIAVAPGSPADAAKLLPGDQIRRIEARPVRTLSLDQSLRMLSGPAGSSVTLSIIRSRENFKKEELTLPRDRRTDAPWTVDVDSGTAVVRVPDPRRVDGAALQSRLAELHSTGVERLLLDLRNVALGSPRDGVALAEIFASGDLFRLKDKRGKNVETLTAKKAGSGWKGPMAVLVNGATAGAAEGVARVLQSRGAKVYGEATYGLGAEAKLIELPDGSGLLLSTLVWETAAGLRWNGDGIEPDHVIRAEGRPDQAEKDQLRKALEELERVSSSHDKAA